VILEQYIFLISQLKLGSVVKTDLMCSEDRVSC